ncbi:MAG: beta-1,6-N-acetylglucosaminyltransferase [Acidobacteria bacterium]|nr:beta-1,6-N-acetylglucosaminyltransferase [Acidobacteriota bacterium]MBW4045665.1 beta-1,6-N-acetylglucosaminyltransferase [Acidobacteriota bacterium]
MKEKSRVAYLILAHTDPEQLKRLVIRLLDHSEADVFVHVDRKTAWGQVEIPAPLRSRVVWLDNRITIWWAGSHIVQATIALLRAALAKQELYSHIVLLSGLDYPLLPSAKIHERLLANPHHQWMSAMLLSDSPIHSRHVDRFWFEDRILGEGVPDKLLRKALEVLLLPVKRQSKQAFYIGSQWWALSAECALYLLSSIDSNTELLNFVQYTFAPDEYFFHTLVYNSPFRDQCPPVVQWKEGLSPYTMADLHMVDLGGATIDCYPTLKGSNKLFIRKVTSNKSQTLLDRIDQDL